MDRRRHDAEAVVVVRAAQRARRLRLRHPSRYTANIVLRPWAPVAGAHFFLDGARTVCPFHAHFASCMRPDARLKRMRAASAVISACVADELALANAFCALSISSIEPTPLLKRPNAML